MFFCKQSTAPYSFRYFFIFSLLGLLLLTSTDMYSQLFINELLADGNKELIYGIDYNGDWLEIYNSSDEPISLSEYTISDDPAFPEMFTFPDLTLSAGEFILLLCNDGDETYEGYISLPFKLTSDGETVTLYKKGLVEHSLTFPPLGEGESYGLFPDASGEATLLPRPSPSVTNYESDIITLSHSSGFYDKAITLKAQSALGLEIYYSTVEFPSQQEYRILPESGVVIEKTWTDSTTIDKIPTNPQGVDLAYHEWQYPKELEKATPISLAYKKDSFFYEKYNNTYFIDMPQNLPVVSIRIERDKLFDEEIGIYVPGNKLIEENPQGTGNYYYRGREWEREAYIDFFDNSGEHTFFTPAGIRIHGGLTRHAAQKSLRLYSRDDYGSVDFPGEILDRDNDIEYKRLILNTGMGEWTDNQTMLRNRIAKEIAKSLNLDYTEIKPVEVYINGVYWGIHLLSERYDDEFLSDLYDIDEENINMLLGDGKYYDYGSNESYKEFLAWLDVFPSNHPHFTDSLDSKIDLNNLIDYTILKTYLANTDWPSGNLKTWNSDKDENHTRFRWLPYDFDASVADPNIDMLKHISLLDSSIVWPNPPAATFLFRKIFANQDFRLMFFRRYEDLLSTELLNSKIRGYISEFKSDIIHSINRHIDRWGNPDDIMAYEEGVSVIQEFFRSRHCNAYEDLKEFMPEIEPEISCIPSSIDYEVYRDINVYPVPAADILNIELSDELENLAQNQVSIKVFGLKGKVMMKEKIIVSQNIFTINTASLPIGTYYLEIDIASRIIRVPFVKS